MRPDATQPVLPYPDVRADQARLWRAAAEASLQQFPNDTRRYRYYTEQAERLEALTR
jgi:hypothetical protein